MSMTIYMMWFVYCGTGYGLTWFLAPRSERSRVWIGIIFPSFYAAFVIGQWYHETSYSRSVLHYVLGHTWAATFFTPLTVSGIYEQVDNLPAESLSYQIFGLTTYSMIAYFMFMWIAPGLNFVLDSLGLKKVWPY